MPRPRSAVALAPAPRLRHLAPWILSAWAVGGLAGCDDAADAGETAEAGARADGGGAGGAGAAGGQGGAGAAGGEGGGGAGGAGAAGGGPGGDGGAGGAGAAGGDGGQGGAGAAGGDGGAGGAGGAGGDGGAGGAGGDGGAGGGGGGAGGDGGGAGGAVECTDLTLYPDEDADGFGVDRDTVPACLLPDERREGFAREANDCGPDDAWRNPAAEEICGDYVDDDCDGDDAECPTSELANLQRPNWNCVDGPAPANVYAWAHFAEGNAYFRANACFVFFEGLPGEFYVERVNVVRTSNAAGCDTINGCVCPSLNGWPSYDRRLYAFTKGTAEPCSEVSILDHGGEDQPVSSSCRKYLYQLHFYDIDLSFLAFSAEALDRRITQFPTVEIACAEDRPHANLPFQSLMETPIRRNASWTPLR